MSITIDHREPLELKRFTASMLCVESQYKKYLAEEGIENDDYRLYINEVRQGSIVIEFIKGSAKKLFEHYVLEGFVKFIEKKCNSLKKQETNDDLKDLKELGTIFDAVSTDYSSNITFGVHVGGNVTNTFNVSGIDANAIVSECLRQINSQEPPSGEMVQNAVLHWKSAGDDKKSLSIDKGVIEDVEPNKKVKLICNDDLKQQMVSENENNPFNMFFIVDAEVKRVEGNPVAYVIKRIHASGKINDD